MITTNIKEFARSVLRTRMMRVTRLVKISKNPRYVHLTGLGKSYIIFGDDEAIKEFSDAYTDTSNPSKTYQI